MKIAKSLCCLLTALGATALLASPTRAQDPAPVEQASSVQIEAARDTLNALMFETGLLEQTLTAMAETEFPAFRERVADSELRQSLSESGRAALDSFAEETPSHIAYELRIGAAELIEATVGPVAHTFSAEEWNGIAAFLRDEEGRQLFVKLANGGRASLTPEEIEVGRRFYETPAGRAFARGGREMNRLLYETMDAQMPIIVGRMQLRLLRRFCDALADECPSEIRERVSAL